MAKQWYLVGESASFDDLEALIADHQLQKGDRVRAEMKLNVPVAQAFDVIPNSWWPAPSGMHVIDIWGTGWPVPWSDNWGYVEMEADPAWLLAIFAFIKTYWIALVIAGVVLMWLISKIKIWLYSDLGTTPPPPNGNGGESDITQLMYAMVVIMMMSMMMNVMSEGM